VPVIAMTLLTLNRTIADVRRRARLQDRLAAKAAAIIAAMSAAKFSTFTTAATVRSGGCPEAASASLTRWRNWSSKIPPLSVVAMPCRSAPTFPPKTFCYAQ
jgi:hypothetical protein